MLVVACAVLSAWRELRLPRLRQFVLSQKWIREAFAANRCRWAVTREHSHIVAERE